jgi:predicted ribosomally synthesized peptide with SipW-like signal peptide
MLKRNVLLSLVVAGVVAISLVGGTFAGYSDTEVSSGEISTGGLDLLVARSNSSWTEAGTFRDDEPYGNGLEPLFIIDDGKLNTCYTAYRLLWNAGNEGGTAYFHLKLTGDTTGIADTTDVTIWYDVNGNGAEDAGEKIFGTLGDLECSSLELGPLSGFETRRFWMKICPECHRVLSCYPCCYPGEKPKCCDKFELDFDTEFKLTQPNGAYSDTEITSNYIAGVTYSSHSPGWWKSPEALPSEWIYYTPNMCLQNVFDGICFDPAYNTIKNNTLLEALGPLGPYPGDDVLMGAKVLMFQGCAALLSSTSTNPAINFPYSNLEVIDMVNAALASHDKQTMLDLANHFKSFCNL